MTSAQFVFLLTLPMLAQVSEPRGGVILTRDGAVREMAGVSGAFIPGDILVLHASRVASSGSFTVAKRKRTVWVSGGSAQDSPPGDAIFGFNRGGTSAYAYFPSSGSFVRIRIDTMEALPIPPALLGGEVITLSGDLTIWVRRDDGIHAIAVRLADGAVESDTALGFDAHIAVGLPDGTLVYARESTVMVIDPSGGQQSIETPGAIESLALMGDGWIHAVTAGGSVAVRLRSGSLQMIYLPEAPVKAQVSR